MPKILNLKGYQRVGRDFLATRRGGILADEMGLGKTAQAVCAVNSIRFKNVLIVCPASLKLNWREELRAWLAGGHEPTLLNGSNSTEATGVVIINYDILRNHKWLFTTVWDAVILDEAQYCKNWSAKRTKAVFKLKAKRRWLLTGTPMLNRPRELWALWKLVDPENAPTYRAFATRYCGARAGNGWDDRGATNRGELAERIAPLMLRRLKSDVLADLPEKTRQSILLPADQRDIRKAITDELEATRLRTVRGLGEGMGDLAKARKLLGLAKVSAAVEHIIRLLDSEQKVVVFAYHKEVIARLHEALGGVVITGETPQAKRHAAVNSFQNDPATRVFIGNLQAAGVGLTLTAARVCVIVELDWTPGVLAQAEDRIHRIGQHWPVLVQYILFEGSLDARLFNTLGRKAADIAAIVRKTEGEFKMSLESILEGILGEMAKQTALLEKQVTLFEKQVSVCQDCAEPVRGNPAATQATASKGEVNVPTLPNWDPRTEPIMSRYVAEKRAALEHVGTAMGIQFTASTTGAELHQMILDASAPAPEQKDAVIPEQEKAAGPDLTPEAEPTKSYTRGEVSAALVEYCKKFPPKADGKSDISHGTKIIEAVAGAGVRLNDVSPDLYPRIMGAIAAKTAEMDAPAPEDGF